MTTLQMHFITSVSYMELKMKNMIKCILIVLTILGCAPDKDKQTASGWDPHHRVEPGRREAGGRFRSALWRFRRSPGLEHGDE